MGSKSAAIDAGQRRNIPHCKLVDRHLKGEIEDLFFAYCCGEPSPIQPKDRFPHPWPSANDDQIPLFSAIKHCVEVIEPSQDPWLRLCRHLLVNTGSTIRKRLRAARRC